MEVAVAAPDPAMVGPQARRTTGAERAAIGATHADGHCEEIAHRLEASSGHSQDVFHQISPESVTTSAMPPELAPKADRYIGPTRKERCHGVR